MSAPVSNWSNTWEECRLFVPVFFAGWLAPLALGAVCSMSFRTQMLAMMVTFGGTCLIVGVVACGGITLFGSSPWWTTVPILVAFLVVSRLRAYYWLRDRLNWRTRLTTSLPVWGTALTVLIILPFDRVYSVPNISWRQIDAYLDQIAPAGQHSMSSEKRQELIRYIEAYNAVPPEYEDLYAILARGKSHLKKYTFDEHLLVNYVYHRDNAESVWRSRSNYYEIDEDIFVWIFRSPWESARRDRILRAQIIAYLGEQGVLREERVLSIRWFVERLRYNDVAFDSWTSSYNRLNVPFGAPVAEEYDDE
jgi:hypothetical protein